MAQRIVREGVNAWKRVFHVSARVCPYNALDIEDDSALSETVHLPETIRLKSELFRVDAVTSITLSRNFITVAIGHAFEWDDVEAEVIAAITSALRWTGKVDVR